MKDLPVLPVLDNMPSVLETAEVNAILTQIVAAAEDNPAVDRNGAVELMVDAIFARGYRPDERLNAELSERILRWVEAEWGAGDVDFAGYATTVLANLACGGVARYLRGQLEADQRPGVREEIQSCLRERGW